MKPLFLLIITLICFKVSVYSQAPGIEWQRCYGGNNGDYPRKIVPTSDGGYIVVGYTEGGDNGDVAGYHGNILIEDAWVVKLSSTGAIQWQRCVGGDYMDHGEDIVQLPDGSYAVLLSSATDNCMYTGNHGGLDYRLVKLTSNGDVVWQKSYGGSKNEYAFSLALTKDGGYYIAGHTESTNGDITTNHGDRDCWVTRLDGNGNLLWQKSYGGSGDDEAWSICVTNDEGFIISGITQSNDGDVSGNHGKQDGWVMKGDKSGNMQWQLCVGGSSQFEHLSSVQATADGGYILTGSASSNDGNISGKHEPLVESTDVLLVKLNSAGKMEWQKCYGGSGNDAGFFVQPTRDGGYIVCGFAEIADGDVTCHSAGTEDDMWILKVNSVGGLQWQKDIGGNYFDDAFCIQPLQDGSYILCGGVCSKDVNESDYHKPVSSWGTCSDYWIVKLAAAPAPVSLVISSPAAMCKGATDTLTAAVFNGGLNPVYHWKRNGTDVGNNTSTYIASDFKNNDLIYCEVTTKGTCDATTLSATTTKTIQLSNAVIHPSFTISADKTTVCECEPVTLKATVTNGGTAPIFRWNVNGMYTGVSGNSYIRYIPQAGDVISCNYMDDAACIENGYSTSNTIVLQDNASAPPQVTITSSVNNVCTGTAITFTAQATNAGTHPTYKWMVNGTEAGTNNSNFTASSFHNGDIVNCAVTTDPSAKCAIKTTAVSNSITTYMLTPVSPSISISANNTTICTGSTITFTSVAVNAGGNPSYQWRVNGAAIGTNSKSFTTSTLSNGDIVSCLLKPDPSNSCSTASTALSNSITITVTQQQSPVVSITASDNNVCAGKKIVFTATAQNIGVSPAYQWEINNQTAGSNSSVFETNQLNNGDQVLCKVMPGSDAACYQSSVSSAPVSIVIKDTPVISINPADTFVRAGIQLQLLATITGAGYTYQWFPQDQLEDPFTLSPLTKPLNKDAIYTLQAKSSSDCKAGKTITVKVFTSLAMPGAFTPNNDGINDVFRIPPHVSLSLYEFAIYNRWGKKIFTTRDINNGWTGTIYGLPADAGVYIYTIKGSNEKGVVNAKGSFVLVR